MIREHDRVVLTNPIPAEGLEAGDGGAGVHVYGDGRACGVGFIALDGAEVHWHESRSDTFPGIGPPAPGPFCCMCGTKEPAFPLRASRRPPRRRWRSLTPRGPQWNRCPV